MILFTGKSGFLSDKLLGEIEGVKRFWIKDLEKEYGDSSKIESALRDLGVEKNDCSLLVVDEHMYSRQIKARNTLLNLANLGFKKFGFATFVGPRHYHQGAGYKEVVSTIFSGIESSNLFNHLLFPDTRNLYVWALLNGLERLSDYYEKSNMVLDFIDTTLDKIKKSTTQTTPDIQGK